MKVVISNVPSLFMYERAAFPVVQRLAQLFPVLEIIGPRQSGKTTLAKTLFPHLPYVSLEDLALRLQAEEDPRTFLHSYLDGAIFDEVQHVPHILSYLQQIVDESPQKGRYVLIGSQNFALNPKMTQSLAGRVGIITLLPLSSHEMQKNFQEKGGPLCAIFKGGYPALYQQNMNPLEFYPNYIQTYIEKDVRQLKNIGNIGLFHKFLKLCAGRIGQPVNFSSLGQEVGISHTTAREWLTILEASYILFTIQPYYHNLNKRLVKMPKLYFYDTGLACNLLGLEKEGQLETHYLKGALFENLMALEIIKSRRNRGLPSHLYFWRDHMGHEVDLIGEWGGHIHAMAIKHGAICQKSYTKNLQYFMKMGKEARKEPVSSYLIYTGSQEGSYLDIALVPMDKLHSALLET